VTVYVDGIVGKFCKQFDWVGHLILDN